MATKANLSMDDKFYLTDMDKKGFSIDPMYVALANIESKNKFGNPDIEFVLIENGIRAYTRDIKQNPIYLGELKYSISPDTIDIRSVKLNKKMIDDELLAMDEIATLMVSALETLAFSSGANYITATFDKKDIDIITPINGEKIDIVTLLEDRLDYSIMPIQPKKDKITLCKL